MANDTHEGWSNRETWLVNLWIHNDESTYNDTISSREECVERAVRGYEDGTLDDMFISDENDIRKNALASLEEILESTFDGGGGFELRNCGLAQDLLRAAYNRVDWREIATSMLAGLKLEPLYVEADESCDGERGVYSFRIGWA